MKITHIFLIIAVYQLLATVSGLSQEATVLKTIPLSSSASLLIKQTAKPVLPSGGSGLSLPPGAVLLDPASPLARQTNEIYIITLKTATKEVDVDHTEFHSVSAIAKDSVMPRFAVFDAALDGSKLYYLFAKQGKCYLAVADVDSSGNVSNYRQKPLHNTYSAIDDAHFIKDVQGRVTLRIRGLGKKTETFQFDANGDAFSVPADSVDVLH